MSTDLQPIHLDPQTTAAEIVRLVRKGLTDLGCAWEAKEGYVVQVQFSSTTLVQTEKLGLVLLLEVDTQRLPRKVTIDKLIAGETLRTLRHVCGYPIRVAPQSEEFPRLTYVVYLQPQEKTRLPDVVSLSEAGEPPNRRGLWVPIGFGAGGTVWQTLQEIDCALVAGTRRRGKSTFLNTSLAWLLSQNSPDKLRVALVDPKRVELKTWQRAPHLVGPVARTLEEADALLGQVLGELEGREILFDRADALNLDDYNASAEKPLPIILVVVDELGDLALQLKGTRTGALATLTRIVQLGGAFGIHAFLATQRPAADVVDGILKANVATRIAFSLPDSANFSIVLGPAAGQRLPRIPDHQGRMIAKLSTGYQVLQGFHLPTAELKRIATDVAVGTPSSIVPRALGNGEIAMIAWALEVNDGGLSIENIQQFMGLPVWQARKLAERWEARGWLAKDRTRSNRRHVTGALKELAERWEAGEGEGRFEGGLEGDEQEGSFEEKPGRFEDSV